MNDNSKKAEKLQEAMDFFNKTHITTEEATKFFKFLIKKIKEIKDINIEELKSLKEREDKLMSEIHTSFDEMKNDMQNSSETTFARIKQRSMESMDAMFRKLDVQKKMDKMYTEHEIMMRKMEESVPDFEQIIERIPKETPQEERDKLESLRGDERLSITAVKDLRDELDKLKKQISEKSGGHAVFASQRGAVKAYDISSQLNSVLKTFALPAFWRVISVHTSSVPNILRETTDYTTDASVPSITFTSEISAASTLASGQSVIIIYAEN